MEINKEITLDSSKLYGFKLVKKSGKATTASKIGGKGQPPVRPLDVVLGSKIGVKGD